MLRVIHSTVQGLDIDTDREEDFDAAVNKALDARDEVRETYSLDEIGQKAYRIAVLPYTDPDGNHRWAVLDESPAEVDWQDTDDLDEAITTYEELVRDTTKVAMPRYDEDGDELPVWDATDVDEVSAENIYDAEAANASARLIDAQWAHQNFTTVEHAYQQATQRRQVAFAKSVDSFGRGGQAVLSKRVDLKEPTVKAIADKGRAILAVKTEGEK